jgi:lysophospholipase L1-like esterase
VAQKLLEVGNVGPLNLQEINSNFLELYGRKGGFSRPFSVSALGDSITGQNNPVFDYGNNPQPAAFWYANKNKAWGPSSWLVRGAMRSACMWYAHEFVLGYSGGTSATVLNITLPMLLGQPFGKPDLCEVMIGTNDVTGAVPIPTVISNLNQIYAALSAAGIQPMAATIPPGGAAQAIELLNYAILRNAKAQGIPCVDYYSALVNYATGNYIAAYTNDNIHPNSTGASIMGYLLNLAIQGSFGSGLTAPLSLIDLSAVTTQNRHPDFDALAAGTINTAGSYPTGWPAPTAAITTMFNSAGSEPGASHTMRAVNPGVAGTTPNYLGQAWSLAGNGVNNYNQPGPAIPAFTAGDRLALYFRVKWLPLAVTPTAFGDFQVVVHDSGGTTVAGLAAGVTFGLGNVINAQIGGEANYVAGDFYEEFTVVASQSASNLYVYAGAYGQTYLNTNDSLTIANLQIVNLTQAGIL